MDAHAMKAEGKSLRERRGVAKTRWLLGMAMEQDDEQEGCIMACLCENSIMKLVSSQGN